MIGMKVFIILKFCTYEYPACIFYATWDVIFFLVIAVTSTTDSLICK